MTQLARKPLFLALILCLPLWVVFNNFVVAIAVAALIAALLAMCVKLLALEREKDD